LKNMMELLFCRFTK